MSLVLIVGPSGVGKSTLARIAAETVGATYVDLDCAANAQGAGQLSDHAHERAAPLIERYVADGTRWYVVDVGAGFQAEQPEGAEWMRPHRERMIAVMAEPGVVLGRLRKSRQDGRTLEGLNEQEFSSVRQAIYDMAQHRVDNSGDIDKHARQLADLIRRVMAPTGS